MVVLVMTYRGDAERIADAAHGLLEGTLCLHHVIMYFRKMRFQRDLHMVQAGCNQFRQVTSIRQAAGIGVQPGDLPQLFCMGNQFGQVSPAGWARRR